MKFSDDRIRNLSHLIYNDVLRKGLVEYPDEEKAIRAIKKAMNEYFGVDDEIDTTARKKIASLKRVVREGTPEWTALYQQYSDEERHKKGR